jgi:hypothetical protein
MEQTLNERRRALTTDLVASARLRDGDDQIAIFSQDDAPPIQNLEIPIGMVKSQLTCNGASPENAHKFVSITTLSATGSASGSQQPRSRRSCPSM